MFKRSVLVQGEKLKTIVKKVELNVSRIRSDLDSP